MLRGRCCCGCQWQVLIHHSSLQALVTPSYRRWCILLRVWEKGKVSKTLLNESKVQTSAISVCFYFLCDAYCYFCTWNLCLLILCFRLEFLFDLLCHSKKVIIFSLKIIQSDYKSPNFHYVRCASRPLNATVCIFKVSISFYRRKIIVNNVNSVIVWIVFKCALM